MLFCIKTKYFVYIYTILREKKREKKFLQGVTTPIPGFARGGGGISIYLPPSALFLAGGVVIRFGQEMPAKGRLCAKFR